jgi:Fe2+ transport system protein FeoA
MNFRLGNRITTRHHAQTLPLSGELTLDRVPPGSQAFILGFDALEAEQQGYLRAYGVLPGRSVQVLQHRPETVIQIEFTELAFEKEIARQIQVALRSESPAQG